MNNIGYRIVLVFFALLTITSCIEDKDLYKKKSSSSSSFVYSSYIYPFKDEIKDATAEITIRFKKEINSDQIISEIPYLKYNKSWLLMLTQDDCKQAAFCRTWAAINGKPISSSELYPTTPDPHDLYYNAEQLEADDLPPTIIPAGETLGCTDGNGNEVRFAITTTLAPEFSWMNAETNVNPGFSDNYYRFYMKSGLTWNEVKEMLNYGTGIAFHDVNVPDIHTPSDILNHYKIAQDTIWGKLGRRCKMLAEPNGDKMYVTAAFQYPEIQTMVAQSGTVKLYPFKVNDDLKGKLLNRTINGNPESFKNIIEAQMQLPKTEREAIHIGVHGTDNAWIKLLQWVNNTYGKGGDDSVWFPSQEEYYEYNYYRIHSTVNIKQVDQNTIKLIVNLTGGRDFYYPSISINLMDLADNGVDSMSSNSTVTGLSCVKNGNGIYLNIDCRKSLVKHATHFVEQYEKDKSDTSEKADAVYFVNMLKESAKKEELSQRIK